MDKLEDQAAETLADKLGISKDAAHFVILMGTMMTPVPGDEEIAAAGMAARVSKRFHITESATKHFVELVEGKLKMSPEAVVKSFAGAVEKLGNTAYVHGEKVVVDGWEFIVKKGKGGPLDTIIHAIYKNKP